METNDFRFEKLITKNKLKFRAECISDILLFQKSLLENELYQNKRWNLSYTMMIFFPDITCELETDLEIDEVRNVMRLQIDSHVMIQSLTNYSDYTGERDYDIPW